MGRTADIFLQLPSVIKVVESIADQIYKLMGISFFRFCITNYGIGQVEQFVFDGRFEVFNILHEFERLLVNSCFLGIPGQVIKAYL